MLDNGMAMADIDRMEYGLYMQIVKERAKRRHEREARKPQMGRPDGDGDRREKHVYLHRGFIDEIM